MKLEKPIEVLFEGVDENIYKQIDNSSLNLVDDIKEDFAFLHVGLWGKGGYGEDRKNIAVMIKCFLQAFANQPSPPALLLKTNGASFSHLDKADIIKKLKIDENSILIDDRKKKIDQWIAAGGIGILHTDAASTIEKLKELGL